MIDSTTLASISDWERERAERTFQQRNRRDPFAIGRWVVVKQIPPQEETNLGYYEGCIGEIVPPLQKPNNINVLFLNEKHTVKSFSLKNLAPVSETTHIAIDRQQELFWNAEKQMQLAQHVCEIEDYTYWQHDSPSIPEWYLHSLKTSTRQWRIPPHFARIPPMGLLGSESRYIHYTPRQGHVELTIQSDGQVYNSELQAFSVLVNTVKDILPPKQRATLSYFEARAYLGKRIARCCAVFNITNSHQVPDVVIDSTYHPTLVREGHVLETSIARLVSQYLDTSHSDDDVNDNDDD